VNAIISLNCLPEVEQYGASPRFPDPHTIYEFGIVVQPGEWFMNIADPGPRSRCSISNGVSGPKGEKERLEIVLTEEEVWIQFDVSEAGKAELWVYDLLGKVLLRRVVDVNAGSNRYALKRSLFQSGMYFVTFNWTNGKYLTGKFVIVQ